MVCLSTTKRQNLTKNINLIFVCIEYVASETSGQKKDFSVFFTEKSDLVALTGLKSNLIIEDLRILSKINS